MSELANCPKCGTLFMKNNIRAVCDGCYKEEDLKFKTVHEFIRKRENRTATIKEVVAATGVEEDLIYRFIRTGKLQLAQFPNMGYPCDSCSTLIREGKLCKNCAGGIRSQMSQLEKEQEHAKKLKEAEKKSTFYSDR
ncbi:TIGR03826 family flagellar region protein [Litchfieldia salsa]|uniref:Flagellar operon protein TIGR03826 n=1 Tax=Litchfieldia salsa TaxID=930152 RepID=A0A1H0WX85_9BACI|nr:TIGR03826 family flagellar region protein [Litchfieldia salsa]SDP95035.1 flagellar operon protein TIGR03826 [Litchfieldia salsa]